MRISVIAVALMVCLSSAYVAQGQAPAGASANASRYGIGVVDISYIFKNHLRFKAMMDQMKGDVKKIEDKLRDERRQIAKREEMLKSYKPGSANYKNLEEQLAEEKAKFNLRAAKERKELLEREAKIYYQTYLEVNDAVKYYAQRSKLGLVLRFNGDPIDPNRREDVLRAINKPVVYQGSVDITPDILQAVNRGAARPAAAQANRRPAIPGRRQ